MQMNTVAHRLIRHICSNALVLSLLQVLLYPVNMQVNTSMIMEALGESLHPEGALQVPLACCHIG